MATTNKQITQDADDGFEYDDQYMYLTNSLVYFGYSSSPFDAGVRWQSVDIERGVVITSAILSVRMSYTTGAPEAVIKGILEADTAVWSAGNRPSQRAKTTAEVSADEADWTNWGVGNWTTIDVTDVIQEIIDQSGWEANNDLALVIEDLSGTGNNYTSFDSYEAVGTNAAKLDIEYIPSNGSLPTISKQIGEGTDDCYETNDSSIVTSGFTMVVGVAMGSAYDIGLRWQSIGIQRRATINSAILSVLINSDTGTLKAVIQGIAEDDPNTWHSTTRPSQRSKTSAEVSANEADWTNWGVGNWAEIDVTDIVQEIINRAGWDENNALALAIESLAGASNNYSGIASYEASGNVSGAKLDIEYTPYSSTLPAYAVVIKELDGTPHTIKTTAQKLSTTTNLSGSTDTFALTLMNESDVYSYIVKGCQIEIYTADDGILTKKLDGFITEVTRTLDSSAMKPIIYVEGEDGEVRLNNIIFSGRFFDNEVSALLKAILDSDDFTTGETLRTLADIDASNAEIEATVFEIDEATYSWRELGGVIQELAETVGFEWYRDTDKVLHFYNPENKATTHTIVDSDLDGAPELYAVGDIVNRAIVIGGFEQVTDQDGTAKTGTTTVTSTTAKTQSFTPTEDYLGSVLVYTELVTDSDSDLLISIESDSAGSPDGVHLSNGQMTLNVESIEDGDYSEFRFPRDVTLTPGDTYWIVLEGTDADGVKVGVAGATLDFVTRYPVRVAIMANDDDSQATYANEDGSPGIYTAVMRDESIEDSQLAETKANEMLTPYPEVAGSLMIHGDSIKAGDIVQLTIALNGVDVDKTMKVRSSTQDLKDIFIYNSLELEEV